MASLGRQILAELKGIPSDRLDDPGILERLLVKAAQDAGTTVVESSFNRFTPHGVTGVIVIQESHLAIHTWPEHGYAALDVFTCSASADPEQIAQTFSKSVGAKTCETRQIDRGEGAELGGGRISTQLGATRRSIWFTDRQDDIALSLRHAGVLHSEQSDYQKVEILASEGYGKILLLDGQVAFTERDEFVYHELIAHVPALHHPAPERVLIIGGGDGGACREFLKHKSVENVTVVEIDPVVTSATRAHLPGLAQSLDDPRARVVVADGAAYLAEAPEPYDIIAIDCLDSAGNAQFDQTFFGRVSEALKPGGLMVTQACAPTLSVDRFRASVQAVTESIGRPSPYLGFLPTYSTGMLSFLLAGAPSPPTDLPPGLELRYVTSAIVQSAFALPAFIEQTLEVKT